MSQASSPLRFFCATGLCLFVLAHPLRGAAAADFGTPWHQDGVKKLQACLQVDTTNPPGREAVAANLMAGWCRQAGVNAQVIPVSPARASVVARLKGSGARPPLLLLHHLDVVPADASRWRFGPFSGQEVEGRIYGRGALDMKGLGVMMLMAMLRLHREKVPLNRDVVMLGTPDEELGGEAGVGWLQQHHPDVLRASEALNEGGAGVYLRSGQPVMGIQTAERGTLWLRVTATGAPGHGSQERPDSAPRRLLRALARLEQAPRRWALGPETEQMLAAFAQAEGGVAGAVLKTATLPGVLPWVAPLLVRQESALGPLLSDTINPTVLQAGGGNTNVVPPEASVQLDVRLLPGNDSADFLQWLQQQLQVPGDPPLALKVLSDRPSSRSEPTGPLWEGLRMALGEVYPNVPVVPILTPGGSTDSSFLRPLGINALGCLPILATQDQLDTMHGDDEFITRAQFVQGMEVVYRAVRAAATDDHK